MIGFLLGVTLALAAEAPSAVISRVTADQRRTARAVDELRAQIARAGAPTPTDAPEAKRGLFTVHDEARAFQAAPGRLLFGEVVNRLVVGSDGSPAILELNAGQGAFSGLRVLGRGFQGSTDGRLGIGFDRLVLRTGRVVPIKGAALDGSGGYGLEAQVFSSKALAVAGAMGASFISGLATSQQTETTTAFGFSQVQPTGRNAILQGVAQTAGDQSKRLVEDATKEKPVFVVESGTAVTVYLDEEVRW
jgi:hypothetical protein